MRQIQKDTNGFIPVILIVGLIALAIVAVCLYFWFWYTLGGLIIIGGIWTLFTFQMPKFSLGIVGAGGIIILLAYLGVI